jgi:hypothetical protein
MIFGLSITSWASRGIYATHYYGRIRFAEQQIDLEHEVEITDERYDDNYTLWKKFSKEKTYMTGRFLTRADVLDAARKWLWDNAKPADTLEIRYL